MKNEEENLVLNGNRQGAKYTVVVVVPYCVCVCVCVCVRACVRACVCELTKQYLCSIMIVLVINKL